MDKCNVTGATENLKGFYINGDFGQKAEYFTDDHFEFHLCEAEYNEFMKKGRDIVVNFNREDYTQQYDKWFTSREIYELLRTFKYVPKGYYSIGWFQLSIEEEQWQWENKEENVIEFLEYERLVEDLFFAYSEEQLDEVISRRFPDKHNPYKKKDKIESEYIEHLHSLNKDDLINIILNNKIAFQA